MDFYDEYLRLDRPTPNKARAGRTKRQKPNARQAASKLPAGP